MTQAQKYSEILNVTHRTRLESIQVNHIQYTLHKIIVQNWRFQEFQVIGAVSTQAIWNIMDCNIALFSDNMFIAQWSTMVLAEEEQPSTNYFTFQAQLHRDGTIVFIYKEVCRQ